MKYIFRDFESTWDVEDALGLKRGDVVRMTRHPNGKIIIQTKGKLSGKNKNDLDLLVGKKSKEIEDNQDEED